MAYWIAVLALTYLATIAGIVATATGRNRIVVVAGLPVSGAILLELLGVSAPAATPFALALGFGFLALGSVGGSPLVALILSLATRTVRLGTHGGILVTDVNSPAPDREILRGGATIGYLERFAFVGSLLAGQPGAIAVIVAIKGLGRFSELENAAARERFIIGTLVSLTWAGCCTAAILLSR